MLTIPGYAGLALIGTGGFSTVYRARQERFRRTVAVKVLHTSLRDEGAQRRFLRECAIAGSVSAHPHCVTVLDAGLTGAEQPFIVFEHMGGGTLADRVVAQRRLASDEVLPIGVKLCGALASVHAEGIIHRDVKPLNVLLSDFGEPCLTDFGISAMTRGPMSSSMTNSMTPLFTAPEVLDGAPSTHASDLYALGATLYCLLAGRAPHEPAPGEGLRASLQRVFDEPAPRIEQDDVPVELARLLDTSLQRDPRARFADARAMGAALQGVQRLAGGPVDRMVLDGRTPVDDVGDAIEVILRDRVGSGSAPGEPRGRIVIDLPPDPPAR